MDKGQSWKVLNWYLRILLWLWCCFPKWSLVLLRPAPMGFRIGRLYSSFFFFAFRRSDARYRFLFYCIVLYFFFEAVFCSFFQ